MNPTDPSKIVSETLRMSSARRLRTNFSSSLTVSSSVQVGLCRDSRRLFLDSSPSLRGSSSKYDGVSKGLAVPELFNPFRPFLSRAGGAGNRSRLPPFSSSASVPLSLGEDIFFRLLRWSASKYVAPAPLSTWEVLRMRVKPERRAAERLVPSSWRTVSRFL